MSNISGKLLLGSFFIYVACTIFAISLNLRYELPRSNDIKNIKANIGEYTVFYNGEEVDKEHINIDDYRISYDLDKKEVYLAPKDDITLVPFHN